MFELGFDLSLSLWLMFCVVGFIAGFIDAIAGGGGMLTVPMLLSSGLPPHMALGTNKLAATFGSFTASLTYYRRKLFSPKFWRISLLATAIGALIGTLLINAISVEVLNKVLPLIIICTALYTLLSKTTVNDSISLPVEMAYLKTKQWIQGLILGFYDGAAGPGTGAFWTTSSTALYKMNLLLSSGLARSTNFMSNFISLLTFIYLAQVNFVLGISMGLFIMLGSLIGARTAIRFGAKFIRPVFIIMVLLLSIKLALNAWF